MIKQILLSLVKTCAVSAIIATIGWYVFQLNFIECAVVAFVSQIVIFYMWNTYAEYKLRINQSIQETARIQSYDMQGVDVQCAHCRSMSFIPIRFDEDNAYVCDSCGETNSIYVDITVAQSADKLNKKSISIGSYNSAKQEAINELKDDG